MVISGFRREADKNCALLGYYAASGGGILTDVSVHPIGSHLQGSVLGSLKMGPKVCTETSVRNYHYSLCNNPEKRSSQGINIEWWFAVFVCVEAVISGRHSRLHETCMPLA